MEQVKRKISRAPQGTRKVSVSANVLSPFGEVERNNTLQILVLGAEGVGKTSICKRIVGEDENNNEFISRRSVVYDGTVMIDERLGSTKYHLEVYDFEGNIKTECLATYKKYIEQSHGFILIYSQDNRTSFIKIVETIFEIQTNKGPKAPVIVLCNKSDLKDSLIRPEDQYMLCAKLFFVSALKNEGIQEAFDYLVKKCSDAFIPAKYIT